MRRGSQGARTVLFALSGVHGAELFGPSAAQLAMLSSALPVPRSVRLLFVHAVEPWGASYGYKENHQNVDCLKNINTLYDVAYNDSLLVQFIADLDIPHVNETTVQMAGQLKFQEYFQT